MTSFLLLELFLTVFFFWIDIFITIWDPVRAPTYLSNFLKCVFDKNKCNVLSSS
jgi:hypothetical protein